MGGASCSSVNLIHSGARIKPSSTEVLGYAFQVKTVRTRVRMQELLRLKPREPRRNVMIKARMRVGPSWSDALILNLSSKGLMVRSDRPPSRGSYLEIRRGPYVIVARVVWSASGRFGVQTQDPIPADDLISDPDGASAPLSSAASAFTERRRALRPAEVRHEASRQRARAAEFVAVTIACGLIAFAAADTVAEVVSRPLSEVKAALSAQSRTD